MLFVQLSSILLLGYFVTAHCILTPILFKYYYTIRRRTYVLYKIKNRHVFITKPCLSFLLLNFFIFYFPQKYFDAFYRFFDILQGIGISYTNEPFSTVTKGIARNNGNTLIIE